MASLTCEVMRTAEELAGFAPEWRALWRADADATPFQSPEWLLPWWRQFGEGPLRAVAMRRAGEAIGLLPFYIYSEPDTGERKLLPLGVGTSDYLDGVFLPSCSMEDVAEGLEALCGEDGWDALHAPQLRSDSKLMQAMERASGRKFLRAMGESCSRMAAVPMAELPQKIRRNAMYYRNRALRRGPLELTAADGADCIPAFEALREMHQKLWESRGERGALGDERVAAWHREALPLLEAQGLLRLYCLRVKGEMAGAMYALVDPPERAERTQYFYLPAYSTAHAELRPGTLLIALATARAAEEGVRTIDMLRGEEDYKRMWHAEPVPMYTLTARREAQKVAEAA